MKSQLFVLLSDWGGLPIVVLEAIRGGLPVIVTNVGVVNELIVDGEHGFLIERNEKVLLKRRLQQLLSDETLRKKWATIVNDIF